MTPLDILLWVAFPYAAAATFIVGQRFALGPDPA